MENKSIDIINLIEKNPIIQLSSDYQNKFITKIQNNFNEDQQKLFVSSFYIYLNYNSKTDFVIDFDSGLDFSSTTTSSSGSQLCCSANSSALTFALSNFS